MRPRILFTVNPRQRKEIFSPDALKRLESFADVKYQDCENNMSEEELIAAIPGINGLVTCWGSPGIPEEVLEIASELRIISHSAGSVRTYVHDGVFNRGITVTNASSAIAVSVAETTIGLIIGSLRYLPYHDKALKAGKKVGEPGPTHELTGATVGVIGMGEVGKRVMALLGAFGCKILVYDPHKTDKQIEDSGGVPSSLEDLMSESDVVTLHAPNISVNYHMITAEMLSSMKDDALLVNTARGELIDEEALVREAASGRIKVALDVFEATDSEVAVKLRNSPRSMLTPHLAGRSVEARRRQGDVVVEDLRLFFSGERPRNLVTAEMMGWMA